MGRVLIACERSGVFRRAFEALGHDAWSCDIEPADDGSNRHIRGNVLDHLDDGWDMMAVMHPPCTILCNSGSKHLYLGMKKVNGRNPERWAKLAERGSPHWVEAAHDGVIVQAIAHHCLTEQAELVEALRRLRTTAALLLTHGEGCAMNHYGDDWQGVMRGWLVDCRKDVLAAAKVLDKFATRPADLGRGA